MKKMILSLLMATICPHAMADWVLIYKYSDADVYADPATVSRTKDKATMWNVTDSKIDGDFMGTGTGPTRRWWSTTARG